MAETETACVLFIPLDGSGGIFFASSAGNLFFGGRKSPVLAEFFAVLAEKSASTADFRGCRHWFLWVFVQFRESVFCELEFY